MFRDDLEDPGAGRWASARIVGDKKGWYYPQNPNNVAAWDGTWASSGKYNFYAPNRAVRSDTVMTLRDAVTLPAGAYLRFGHGYSFDKDAKRRYDGGILEIRVDDGPWRGVGGLFTHGGYNGKIASNYGNPLKGKRAWTGDSHGWSQARVDLSTFAGAASRCASAWRPTVRPGRVAGTSTTSASSAVPRHRSSQGRLPSRQVPPLPRARVSLGFSWADDSTWVTKVRVSASPKLT